MKNAEEEQLKGLQARAKTGQHSKGTGMTENKTLLLKCLRIALSPIYLVLWGWALKTMWAWFIVPTFNAPILSIPVALGICLLVAMMARGTKEYREKDGEEIINDIVVDFLKPFFCVGMGWIFLQFV